MKKHHTLIAHLAPLLLLACSGDSAAPGPNDTTAEDTVAAPDTASDATPEPPDVAPDTESDTTPDTTPSGPPNIEQALDCGPAPAVGPGNQGELQRYQIDTAIFPDALCNNGDAAVFYFRPAVDGSRDKWLINLNGGGFCANGEGCAARWCGCRTTSGPDGCPFAETTTNFTMNNMNGDERARIGAAGIFRRGDPQRPNPLGDYNHVRVIYCSSDVWSGTRRDVPFTTIHPKTGAEVSYSLHFLGSRIIDAVLAILRREAGATPTWTLGATPLDLPDLDDATEVVLSGGSAGGAGVIFNLDRVADHLRANNTACSDEACPLVVRGLIDAVVGPEIEPLDLSQSFLAELGGSSWEDYLAFLAAVRGTNHGTLKDTSCVDYHRNLAIGDAACLDEAHLLRHHITTPFFVRMALLDQLILSNYAEAGYRDPVLGAFTPAAFGQVLRRELEGFFELPAAAEEGPAMPVAPGVFAPACTKHDTLHDDGEVYDAAVAKDGADHTLFDVFEAWRRGETPSIVTTSRLDRSDTTCPP
jgi:hypothetical protein